MLPGRASRKPGRAVDRVHAGRTGISWRDRSRCQTEWNANGEYRLVKRGRALRLLVFQRFRVEDLLDARADALAALLVHELEDAREQGVSNDTNLFGVVVRESDTQVSVEVSGAEWARRDDTWHDGGCETDGLFEHRSRTKRRRCQCVPDSVDLIFHLLEGHLGLRRLAKHAVRHALELPLRNVMRVRHFRLPESMYDREGRPTNAGVQQEGGHEPVASVRLDSASRGARRRLFATGGLRPGDIQGNPEDGSPLVFGQHFDPAIVLGHDLENNRQSKPGAVLTSRGKRLEQGGALLGRNRRPGVGNVELDSRSVQAGGDANAAVRCRLRSPLCETRRGRDGMGRLTSER